MLQELAEQDCVHCTPETPPLSDAEVADLNRHLPGWHIIDEEGIPHLQRDFIFANLNEALIFVRKVGAEAVTQTKLPRILMDANQVTVEWWTRDIRNLHRNDFVMAAKTSVIFAEWENRDIVDQASDESFPASDAPGW